MSHKVDGEYDYTNCILAANDKGETVVTDCWACKPDFALVFNESLNRH